MEKSFISLLLCCANMRNDEEVLGQWQTTYRNGYGYLVLAKEMA